MVDTKNQETELVSIVMPVYNPDMNYLRAALISIENQLYKPVEVIISLEEKNRNNEVELLLKEFQTRLPIQWFSNKGLNGIFGNLNNAILHAKGRYIQIFCQDDIMSEYLISNQVSDFERDNNIGIVFTAFKVIDERASIRKESIENRFSPKENVLIRKEEAVLYFLKYGCMPGNLSPIMVRNDVFSKTGMFNQQFPFAGDFEFLVRAGQQFNLFYNKSPSLFIRRHYNQASFKISNHQLQKDLTGIYNMLVRMLPEKSQAKAVREINMKVGSLFVHHIIKNLIFGKVREEKLYAQLKDLKIYPMNLWYSIYYYLISIPGRMVRRL